MADPLVIIESLEKSFQHMGRTLEVLRGIDLTIMPGEIMAIVGPSGAGKSTLLHCMGTLDLPSAGKIRLAGEELTTMSGSRLAAVRNREIGFVFQFHHLLPEFTALENVCIPAYIKGTPEAPAQARAKELLDYLGLSARLAHKPTQLSGGEQQRVAVARALMNQPSVIFADEPTGNLDTASSQELHQLIFQLRKDLNQTFLIVTHNLELAAMSDRTVRMSDGNLDMGG
jgi:lipoprotein-releasing system ATP-binding protein